MLEKPERRLVLQIIDAKDIGKKIRAGYHQKQREGIVIIPSFGYWKDKNTGEIKLVEEAAESVRMVYSLYLDGVRRKEIARCLTEQGRKTPAQLQYERYGKRRQDIYKAKDGSYVWTYTSVKNILTDESYAGVLTNHRKQMREGKPMQYLKRSNFGMRASIRSSSSGRIGIGYRSC